MTGFEAGLKNWNSIHSNIIRANQGAESLKQGQEKLDLTREMNEPARIQHEQMMQTDDETGKTK